MLDDFLKFSKDLTPAHMPKDIYTAPFREHNISNVIPSVIEEHSRGERAWDIFSRLLKERIIIIGSGINDFVANTVVAQMLFLSSDDPDRDINLYINSPGGVVYSGLAIYDTMQFVSCNVATICVGLAASMGSVLLTAGSPDRRAALPNSRIMLHQPSGGSQGTAADIEIQAREILWLKRRLYEILAEHSGQPVEKLIEDSERDYWLSATEAQEYGLIDNVLKPQSKKAKTNGKS